MKNRSLNKKETFLLYSALYMYGKEVTLVQSGRSSLKERHCFLPHYLINFLFSSQKIYTWVLTLKVQLHVPLMI